MAVSRIVLALDAPVSVARADAGMLVTESGRASLAGASVEERTRSLIDMAAPRFRIGLTQAWDAMRKSTGATVQMARAS